MGEAQPEFRANDFRLCGCEKKIWITDTAKPVFEANQALTCEPLDETRWVSVTRR